MADDQASAEVRYATAYHVVVRYDDPPVAAMPPRVWTLIETHADEALARKSAGLIASFVTGDGGAIAVVEESGRGRGLRTIELFADGTPPEVASVTPTSLTVREAFAARMTEHWAVLMARRTKNAKVAPPPHPARKRILVGAGFGGGAIAALIALVVVMSSEPPPVVQGPSLTDEEVEELGFERSGGYTMMRPNAAHPLHWDGEELFRAYRVHPDGTREFVGLRLADGSEPAPPPDTRGQRGGGGGGGGGGTTRGANPDHLRAISEGFRRGN